MTGREKIEAAFSVEGSRDLPVVICYESVFLRDHWDQLTKHPWWYLHVSDARQQVAWIRDLIAALDQDWLQMFPWTALEDEEYTTVEVRLAGVFRINKHTGHQEQIPVPRTSGWTAEGVQSIQPDRLPESFEDIDANIPLPDENDVDRAALEDRRQAAAAVIKEFGQAVWPYRHVSGPLWKTYGLWGFEGMMLLIATRPELVRHACERYLAVALRNVREAPEHGSSGIWIEDCLTDMISPEAFATLNIPFLRQLIEGIRSTGMRSIYYFCGNPAGKWDLILSLGMDALALE
ncbi:MAG: hypothetical protein JSV03_03730 [Planctomycetota bacterium]|nr:MAG: hypothetical protein JSV03_03730 [Planctomycetota bacterium]